LVNADLGKTAVNSENHIKPIHMLCGQNTEFSVKVGGTYS
jgi:hypothetical protein